MVSRKSVSMARSRLDGGPAVLNAQLVEVEDNGTAVGVVRSARVELAPAATACCVIRFEPIRDSRWRAYRLDVNVGDLDGRQLTLWAVPGPVTGRLTINGRRQTAFLVFRTKAAEGTGLARLRMTSPGTQPDAGGARVDLQRGHRRRRISAGYRIRSSTCVTPSIFFATSTARVRSSLPSDRSSAGCCRRRNRRRSESSRPIGSAASACLTAATTAASLRCISSMTFLTPRTDRVEFDGAALLVTRLHLAGQSDDTTS